jgi:hypothetical protein
MPYSFSSASEVEQSKIVYPLRFLTIMEWIMRNFDPVRDTNRCLVLQVKIQLNEDILLIDGAKWHFKST